jgi:hypothetical protein
VAALASGGLGHVSQNRRSFGQRGERALRDPPSVWCALAIALIGLDRAAWRTAPRVRLAASPAKTPISVYDPEG